MALTLTLPPETEARLRNVAAAAGTDVNAFVQQAVEEKLTAAGDTIPPEKKTKEQWLAALNRWMAEVDKQASMYPPGLEADDSRETIYEGRGE